MFGEAEQAEARKRAPDGVDDFFAGGCRSRAARMAAARAGIAHEDIDLATGLSSSPECASTAIGDSNYACGDLNLGERHPQPPRPQPG